MKLYATIMVVLLTPALALADVAVVVVGNRAWVIESSSNGQLKINQADHVWIDGQTPGPRPTPPDPPADTLAQRIEQRARLIDEPNIAKVQGLVWQQWSKAMRESGTTYATAISGIDALLPTVLRGSSKAGQWSALHATLKGELTSEPKAAATLDQVAAGYTKAGEASQINFGKLIECILCFIESFQSAIDGDDVTPQPVPMPAPHLSHVHDSMIEVDKRFRELGLDL